MNEVIIATASDFNFYAWVIIPVLIFLARITDVSIGTVRLIFVAHGFKFLAPIAGFFEILIWLLAMGEIMKNLSNPVSYIAYAGGFATGNFIGLWIVEKLSLGLVLIRVVTTKKADELVNVLTSMNCGVTTIDGCGSAGQVKVIFTIVPRHDEKKIIKCVKKFNPKAFYSVEEVNTVEEGIFPDKSVKSFAVFSKLFRPFRKGK